MAKKRVFGNILGITEGDSFKSRDEVRLAGLHNETQAGISGGVNDGADAIVISGGYEDDEDFGDEIVYTGAGGHLKGKRAQTFDQSLTLKNLALARSGDNGLPIRVIRGHQSKSQYSPSSGYQYAGLYYVDDYWSEVGKSGFLIWRYRLVKVNHQSQIESNPVKEDTPDYGDDKCSRIETTVQRVVRSTQVSNDVKVMYDYKCQVCEIRLEGASGPYAEGAHIKGLGSPHNGPDVKENILCLCPNHHVLFDRGGITFNDDLSINGFSNQLIVHRSHSIGVEYVRYHRKLWGH